MIESALKFLLIILACIALISLLESLCIITSQSISLLGQLRATNSLSVIIVSSPFSLVLDCSDLEFLSPPFSSSCSLMSKHIEAPT